MKIPLSLITAFLFSITFHVDAESKIPDDEYSDDAYWLLFNNKNCQEIIGAYKLLSE